MTTNLPSMIAGRYRVIRELGRGGMGAVYLVEHIHTGEQLAMKVLLAEGALQDSAIERFKREARAPAKIRSEHVVRVTDADVAPELGGAPFMVMEALQGKDLEAVVKERGGLPPAEVAWILNQLAGALDKAHAIGIVHRDLKPENLFLHTRDDGSQIVKILDFGISKIREERESDIVQTAGLTRTGAVMGTPFYMAPEQARGLANIGPQADIWALGLVTLRLLTGEVYWLTPTAMIESLGDLLMRIMIDPLPPPSQRFPHLSVNLDAWFARSCDRDLTRRYATVGEQVRAFTQAITGSSLGVSIVTSPLPFAGTMALAPTPAPPPPPPPSNPFIQLQSTTTGGAIVASSQSVSNAALAAGSRMGLILAGMALLLAIGVVSFFVVPRMRGEKRAQVTATATATATTTTTTQTASAVASVMLEEPHPTATATATASASPTTSASSTKITTRPPTPTPTPTKAIPPTPTPTRFNPEAP